jgi:F-type H+-transporting ATPase subunit b
MRASKLWVGLLLWCLMAWMVPGVHAAPEEEGATPATEQKGNLAEELDNGHKNPGPGLEEPQEVRFDLSIYTFVVFALLMLLLWKFAWGPIAAGLDKREQSIAKMIDDAKHASESAQKSLQEYESRLAAAQEEAGRIVGEARKQADDVAAKIRAEAESAAQRERDRAVTEIQQAKNVALQEIAQKSVSTAVDLAGKIIRREVKEADHQQLIRDSLERFSAN